MTRGNYMTYEADEAGSRSKNRFKFEVFWGLNKFLDVFLESQEFTMVFDYVCDIELHYDGSYEFYQVKTSSAKSYTTSKLTTVGKKKKSIIGTLYKIRSKEIKEGSKLSKLAIVSNLQFNDPLANAQPNAELAFTQISDKNKEKILSSLKKEFNDEEINLKDIFFITTDLPIHSYKETMIGKINTFYNEIYEDDIIKPAALLNVLAEEVQLRADFEGQFDSYNDVLEKKGLSANRFEVILDKYSERMFSMAQKCREEIKLVIKNPVRRVEYFKYIQILLSDIKRTFHLRELMKSITEDIQVKLIELDDGETFDFARQYIEITEIKFPIEYSKNEKEIFALIALIKLEEMM
ncbi:DUF4297 domain-containing protein [Enterococcus faecium]|uniref:CD-NTase associated protein 4-like DNA endonuclease domain-containing protein n=3 Tax=Enterococcus TaxID=1350 RepID=A0AB37I6R4_ENTHR|nr:MULTISPECIES: dsDNA nuclease domain-containing protein [Enterococcus]EGP5659630.1 DUF4297 domain-containing protein [Enterococcus faecium]EIT2811698.1 DUF4297 domain-containing protein [Enterococcus faecium]EME7145622.1 DUF4297 domain-containing protein [Enterococcus faecium]MBK5083712.1 DUF4297 domain-containing protein [Enterococcus faecium]MBK5172255.1 DUF4297 domain-containing protein [Enterococcus faecium]